MRLPESPARKLLVGGTPLLPLVYRRAAGSSFPGPGAIMRLRERRRIRKTSESARRESDVILEVRASHDADN
jgi:hypothetical protein